MIALYIFIALIVGWLIYRTIYLKRKQRQYQKAFVETFKNSETNLPTLKTGYSYGFPSFVVTFQNEELLKQADSNGLTNSFVNRISQIHSKFKEFEAERAIFFTWEGRIFNVYSPEQ